MVVLEEYEKKLTSLKVVAIYLFSCSHGDHATRFFCGHKRFFGGHSFTAVNGH